MELFIYTDGGARGNPGPAGAGWTIANDAGEVLRKGMAPLGTRTNNWAEYEAVIRAIEEAKKLVPKGTRRSTTLHFRMDSELVARQLSGAYQVKDEPLQLQFMKIHNARVADFPNMDFTHIPREENAVADALANEAMDAASPGMF